MCLVVDWTKDAIRAGTAQTPLSCRRDHTINDVLLASEVPAIAAFARSAYPKSPALKRVSEGQSILARSLADASGYQKKVEYYWSKD